GALEQAAVQQQRLPAGVHPVLRAGDGAGGAPEGDRRLGGQRALSGHAAIVAGRCRRPPPAAIVSGRTPTPEPPTVTPAIPPESPAPLPRVLADLPVSAEVEGMLQGHAELLPWQAAREAGAERIAGIYTYGHPTVDAGLLGRLPAVRVISNFGVGVD